MVRGWLSLFRRFAERDHRSKMSIGWYVARFYAGMEVDGMRAVRRSDLEAFCPLKRVTWASRGVKREQLVPVISGYGFLQMQRFDAYRWHEVAAQRGFLGFVGGAEPQPASAHEMEKILVRVDDDWVMDLTEKDEETTEIYRRGDEVKFRIGDDGVLFGVVEWVEDDRRYAYVSLRGLFQREMRVKILVEALQKVQVPRVRGRKEPITMMTAPVVRKLALAS